MTPAAILLTVALVAVIVFVGPGAILWASLALHTGREAVGTRSKQPSRRRRPHPHRVLTAVLLAACAMILLSYGGLLVMWFDRGGRR